MAFQVSPNVLVQERDVSLFVPQVSTTAGAFVGNFNWGPAEVFVRSEEHTSELQSH